MFYATQLVCLAGGGPCTMIDNIKPSLKIYGTSVQKIKHHSLLKYWWFISNVGRVKQSPHHVAL